ncbi:hypothetical protein MLD38_003867 [Melastoma candidum]|uniref:Uncharacterized protein n=1 Tax=Melastoma candidum TaxID=119954 RepID=A0ACB9S7S7_9MYRT|nr:hypothetical protein MLD38_003867 [Melastoma candidum]
MAAVEDSGHMQSPSSTLPPYPELIIAAIDALNDPNGSNKTTISRHIESLYPNLPSSHATHLAHHLNRMKQDGDLVLLKNNYMRPDLDAPPKRGRGRPRKNAEPTPLPVQAAAPSLPGPPKSGDSEAQPKSKPIPNVSGKKRGRPRKEKADVSSRSEPVAGAEAEATAAVVGAGGVVKRGRGRPPKAKKGTAAGVVSTQCSDVNVGRLARLG